MVLSALLDNRLLAHDHLQIYAVYTKKINKSNNILLDDMAEDDYTINLGGFIDIKPLKTRICSNGNL